MEQELCSHLNNRKVLLASLIGAAVVVAVGLLVGWEWGLGAMAGLGSGLGAWIGVRYGNKKAREVDQYREEWLGKRKKSQLGAGDSPDGP
jgi:uncharacterized membrane protein YfcA